MEQRRAIFEYRDDAVPKGTLVLEGAAAVAAIAHPIRSKMLTQLGSPKSVKELAAALEVPGSRLYHHLNRLVAAGLVEAIADRRAGSNTERLFRVTARRIEVAGPAAAASADAATDVFAGAAVIGDELVRSMLSDELAVLDSVVVNVTHDQAVELARRLVRVVEDAAQENAKGRSSKARTHVIQIAVARTEQPTGRHVLASSVEGIDGPSVGPA